MKKKAAFHTLGCKVNSYETEAMQELLVHAGYEIVNFEESADVYIINTCSVTNMADRKSRQMLHRAKKKNPQAVIVAAGCYVQAAEEEVKADLSVDLVVGNNQKKDLVSLLEMYFAECGESGEAETESSVIDLTKNCEYEKLEVSVVDDRTRAYIKVQDGCNQFCSYCIIPYTRGRIRSREKEDVLNEVKRLTASGTKEVVLTGIHLSSYGKERGEENGLLELIQLIHETPGLERIRLGSLEPRIITESFVQALKELPKVCPHFHLSLQSGCNQTLAAMNRHYTAEEYFEKCEILRKFYENPAITTDVIVGFPGETEEDFEESRAFLEKTDFFEMHIFKYSRRHGTRADQMDHQIPEPVKTERSEILLKLEQQLSRKYRAGFLGKKIRILLEEELMINGEVYTVGHTPEYVKAAIPGTHDSNQIVEKETKGFLTDEILLCSL